MMLLLNGPLDQVFSDDGFAIYIGNAANAANTRALYEAGVKYVLNVSDRIRFKRVDPTITQHQVALSDYGDTPLTSVIDDCFSVIELAYNQKVGVLVHCQGGVNRSPTVVIAFLMRYLQYSLHSAWTLVRQRRTMASPHERYMQQLIEYERDLFGTTTINYDEYEQTSLQASLRKIRQQYSSSSSPESQFTTSGDSNTNIDNNNNYNNTNDNNTTTTYNNSTNNIDNHEIMIGNNNIINNNISNNINNNINSSVELTQPESPRFNHFSHRLHLECFS